MTELIVQPISVYLGLAITGIFTGLGAAIGTAIAKVYIEPKLQKWKEEKVHRKIKEAFKEGLR